MAFNITSHTKPEDITGYTYKNNPITLNKIPGNVFRPTNHKHWKKNVFPIEVQTHAAAIYAVTGDPAKAAEVAKVPLSVIKKWKQEPWFNQILAEIREENKDKLDGKITEILDLAVEKLKERLEVGDEIPNLRTGETVRVPVKAKDLANISAAVHRVRALDRGTPTAISAGGATSTEEKLNKLAQAFSELAKNNKKQERIFDVSDAEIIEAEKSEALENRTLTVP
jgi:hypothetical protein